MKDPRNYNPRQISRTSFALADPRSMMAAPKVRMVRRRKKVGTAIRNENLTVDGQISRDGGIMSHADGKMHTSKTSYMESLKNKGLVIRD